MVSRGAVDHYPVAMRPVGPDREPVDGDPVEVFQLRPGDQQRLIGWSGLTGYPGADGGVMLLRGDVVTARVGLGEFLIRDGRQLRVEVSAADVFTAYQPTRD